MLNKVCLLGLDNGEKVGELILFVQFSQKSMQVNYFHTRWTLGSFSLDVMGLGRFIYVAG